MAKFDPDNTPVNWPYPINFSGDITPDLLTDSNGIPMIDYANLGVHYNPWFIGHIALGYHNNWILKQGKAELDLFLKIADWFVREAVITDTGVVWEYHFDYFGGQNKPWRSGLSQAHGISTLLRAATITGDNKYDKYAKSAVAELVKPYSDGGMAFHREDGTVSFEEYFYDPPYSVLNGHIFSSIACWEAARYFEEESLKKMAELAFDFVENQLPDYDMGFWSKYSLKKTGRIDDIASSHYHDVHITQLNVLYKITGKKVFNTYSDLFYKNQSNPLNRKRALLYKIVAKLIG
ncbi:MAG: hypothetical protein EA391_00890 [Balneolaceae bacterium]|nr:MAG: hypothetical protein EA391_00890 [Balneolaceae bacterium]